MKINLYWISLVLGLIVLSGCGSSSQSDSSKEVEWEPTMYKEVNNLDGVSMMVKKETVSPQGLTVIFENNSDKQCIYGEYFLLEKNIKGSWYQVPVILDGDYGFNDIGYELASSDVQEWTVDWEWLYDSLDSGEYRIVKNILDFREAGDYDEYHLTAEFTLD